MTSIQNYINGGWCNAQSTGLVAVVNPATAEVLGQAPLSAAANVNEAVQAAARACPEWRRVPAAERAQFLFKLKWLLESQLEELARTINLECGKTLAESRAEMRRAIE